MATTFVCLAAGIDESQMAIASTGFYLSANIGGLVGASLASTVLQIGLRKTLDQGLKGFPDQRSVIRALILPLLPIPRSRGARLIRNFGCRSRNAHYQILNTSNRYKVALAKLLWIRTCRVSSILMVRRHGVWRMG